VRIGNQAAEQIQHDSYGSVVLGAAQMFVDERLTHMGDDTLFAELETLGEKAWKVAFEPDAGIWEYRGSTRVHTYSAALCWAACDRLARIAHVLGLAERQRMWASRAEIIRERLLAGAWDEKRGALTAAIGSPDLDASVLLFAELGLLAPDDPRFRSTCETIGRELMRNGRIMRYAVPDDFGAPETAFLACNFWYIDALAQIGRRDEAREMFDSVLARRNHFGLLSEDIHPQTGELWGNFPQAYSMAGIINTATRLSSSWEDAWLRA
jgi:GH15 family glucan-1,4-alpha-glucosidase